MWESIKGHKRRVFFLPSERPLPNATWLNALKAVNREHGKDKDISKFIRHSWQTKNPIKNREENHLKKDSLIFLSGVISELHSWGCKRRNSFLPLQLDSAKDFTTMKQNQFIKGYHSNVIFPFTFCTSRSVRKGRKFCNVSLFFLLKWHYYISLGHSLIFDYVYKFWILTLSKTTEF